MHLAGRASPRVINQVGMVVGDADWTVLHSLCAYLLQEIRGRDLTLADERFRNSLPQCFRQLSDQEVFENTASAAHRGGIFLIANRENTLRGRAQLSGIGAIKSQRGGYDDPILVLFEDTLAIAELAGSVADLFEIISVEEPN